MLAVLTGLMTGQAPEARSGETPERPSIPVGAVSFDQLLTAMGQQTEALHRIEDTFRREIRQLADGLRAEWTAWRLEHERDADRRDAEIADLIAWRRREEIAEAVRQGRLAMFLLAFRWLTEHWQFVATVLLFVLGLVWVVITGGKPGLDVKS